MLESIDLIEASFALSRAVPRLDKTTVARIPMMATTTRSSIKVNPLFLWREDALG